MPMANENKNKLKHSSLSENKAFYLALRAFFIMVLLFFPIMNLLNKKFTNDTEEIILKIRLKHNEQEYGNSKIRFSNISMLYFPYDIIGSLTDNFIYKNAKYNSCYESIKDFSIYNHIGNIENYTDKIGKNKLCDEIYEWKKKTNNTEFENKIIINEAKLMFNTFGLIYLVITCIVILLFVHLYDRKFPKKYTVCPYEDCKKSVLIYGRWICQSCNNKQPYDKFVTDNCFHCGRGQSTELCEFCGREFYL